MIALGREYSTVFKEREKSLVDRTKFDPQKNRNWIPFIQAANFALWQIAFFRPLLRLKLARPEGIPNSAS